MPQTATAHTTLENVDVECTHCGLRMTSSIGGGGTVRYFHCASCSRWSTSMYTEIFRADSKMRTRKPEARQPQASLGTAKQRIDAWLQSLSVNDPYRVLNCTPDSTDAQLREGYLALARTHHPDRGGNAEQMRRINDAYERVLAHREQRKVMRRPTSLGA